MAKLTERDKRTLRIGALALAAYLILFYGMKAVRGLEASRTAYRQLVMDARLQQQQLETYKAKGELLAKLRGDSNVDLTKLPRSALVAKASEAIQQAAVSGGIKIGPIRETPGNPANGEIAVMRLEAAGQVAGILGLIHQMQNLGYPLIIDGIQLSQDTRQPGMLKVNVDLVILDFEKWQQRKKSSNA